MHRASRSEVSAGYAIRRAFPNYPFGEKRQNTQTFHLSRGEAQFAVDELSPYFQAIERLYLRNDGTADAGTENEVWGAFDPVAATADIRNQTATDPAAHKRPVEEIMRMVKSLSLYSHRIVIDDHLMDWLKEYANPPPARWRTDPWLLSGISFHLQLYSELMPFLDEEAVLPRELYGTDDNFDAEFTLLKERVFPTPEREVKFILDLASQISNTHPNDSAVIESRAWGTGLVSKGTQGGYLLHQQKDLRVLVRDLLNQCLTSSLLHPAITVSWQDPKLARLHRYILEIIKSDAAKREADRSFILTELSTNGAIKPEEITPIDALQLRNSEKVFLEWRDLVSDCISELRDSYAVGSERARLLQKTVRDKERHWQSRFNDVTKQSRYVSRITDPRTSFLTSFSVGAAYSLIAKGDITQVALLAGGGSAAKDLIILMADIVFGGNQRKTRTSLRRHFMALGMREDLLRS